MILIGMQWPGGILSCTAVLTTAVLAILTAAWATTAVCTGTIPTAGLTITRL